MEQGPGTELGRDESDALAAIIQSSDVAIYSKDRNGIITSWNAAAERLYGYAAEEAIGQPISMLISDDRRGEEVDILTSILRGEKIDHFQTQRRAKDGRFIEVSVTISPIHNPAGDIVEASVVARDISERTRAAEESDRLAAIVRSSNDAIYSKDSNAVITSWNPAAERLYGYAPYEAIGQPVVMLVIPERRGEEIEILQRVFRGERVEHYETQRMTKDGSRVDVSITVSPIHNIRGEIVEASVIARDITEQRRVLEALEVAREKELAAQAVRDFVSMVTHDLKQPLSTIAGATSTLRESWFDLDEQDLQRLLDGMLRNSDIMTRMIQDLLLVSRAEAGELHPNKEVVEISDALREIVVAHENTGIELSVPNERLMIDVDRHHLERIVSNLISNARKYGEVPIEVIAAATNGDVELVVADHGPGVPAELAHHLFEKFSRAENVRGMQGTGLGLAIVRSLAEANGAEVAYTDNQPRGARFLVRLRRAN
ncbi:MAG: PAS domain-containing sensor histidine kinase [Actinomycetota bacterium]